MLQKQDHVSHNLPVGDVEISAMFLRIGKKLWVHKPRHHCLGLQQKHHTIKSDAEEHMEAEVAVREVPDKSSLVFVTLGELGR